MSFVKRGEKKMHNMAKSGSKPGMRGLQGDGFGKKGDGRRSGAPHNKAPRSMDTEDTPVSENAEDSAEGYSDEAAAPKSQYDPASGKKAKSIGDLRDALKKLNERSDAGEDSPVGSEGGQDGMHSSSKNATGWMKGGDGKFNKMSKKGPRSAADMDGEAESNPLDEDEEGSDQTKEGMTPKGKSRKNNPAMKRVKEMIKE